MYFDQVRKGRQRAKDGKIRRKDLMDENGEKVYDGFTELAYANLTKTAQRLWGCRTAAGGEAAVFHITLHNENARGRRRFASGAALGVCISKNQNSR